jgi:hypothetical protein
VEGLREIGGGRIGILRGRLIGSLGENRRANKEQERCCKS